jgi:gamma-glutamyltranspeptidase
MTGLGGDAFWLIYDAEAHRVRHLDGVGRAAASADPAAFASRRLSEIPYRGILPATVTTPGLVASWGAAHAADGRLPLARSLESARRPGAARRLVGAVPARRA